MNRTRWPIVALVVGLVCAACMHGPPVAPGPRPFTPGPRIGEEQPLPVDPGPGFLYIRVVSGSDTVSYAVIVHVPEGPKTAKNPKIVGVVGPIDNWEMFFAKVRAKYWAHGPGEAYCARPDAGHECPPNLPRSPAGPYDRAAWGPTPPPHPPPPADGYALVYSAQAGKVNPDDLSSAAASAAAAAADALGQ